MAKSSKKVEYISLDHVVVEMICFLTLLIERNVTYKFLVIFYDNYSPGLIVHNLIVHARTKHIEIDLYFVREKVLDK